MNFLYENDLIMANFHFTQDKHFTFSKGDSNSYIDHIFLPMYMLPMVKDCATVLYIMIVKMLVTINQFAGFWI